MRRFALFVIIVGLVVSSAWHLGLKERMTEVIPQFSPIPGQTTAPPTTTTRKPARSVGW